MSEVQSEQGQEAGAEQGQDPAVEREARRQGWRPAEEFRGNEADWVDASTYVKRGKEIRAHVKAENDRLARELAAANAQIAEMKGTIEEVREYHSKIEERAINTAIERLKKERKTAMAGGDPALAADIDEEIQELKDAPRLAPKPTTKEEPKAKNDLPVTAPPEIIAWQSENSSWLNDAPENEDMVATANGITAQLRGRNDLSVAAKIHELDKRMRAIFPDRFEQPKSRVGLTPGGGEGGGGGRRSNDPVAALPLDAKQAGARYVKQGLYKDLKEYAVEYWKQPGAQAR